MATEDTAAEKAASAEEKNPDPMEGAPSQPSAPAVKPAPAAPTTPATAPTVPTAPAQSPDAGVDPKIVTLRNRVIALLSGTGDDALKTTNYATVMRTKFMTPVVLQQGVQLLWQATKIVIENPHPLIVDAMWDFYVKERDDLMSASKGLRGINNLSADINTKLSVVNALFTAHAGVPWATRKETKFDTRKIVEVLGDDRLYAYIKGKRPTVDPK